VCGGNEGEKWAREVKSRHPGPGRLGTCSNRYLAYSVARKDCAHVGDQLTLKVGGWRSYDNCICSHQREF
jgi:hypothetical protein